MGRVSLWSDRVLRTATWAKDVWGLLPTGWKMVILPALAAGVGRIWTYLAGFQPGSSWMYTAGIFGLGLFILNELRRAGPFWSGGGAYRREWLARNKFLIEEAACLWVGEEPRLEVRIGEDAWAPLSLFLERNGEKSIELDILGTRDLYDGAPTTHRYIKREDVRKIAKDARLHPKFPF